MPTSRPKPQSLRPLPTSHRRWFWGLMAVGAVVIVVGWFLTLRQVLTVVPDISSAIDQGIETAVEKVEEAQVDPVNEIDQATNAWDALKQGYEEEKARQESYGQEDNTP